MPGNADQINFEYGHFLRSVDNKTSKKNHSSSDSNSLELGSLSEFNSTVAVSCGVSDLLETIRNCLLCFLFVILQFSLV